VCVCMCMCVCVTVHYKGRCLSNTYSKYAAAPQGGVVLLVVRTLLVRAGCSAPMQSGAWGCEAHRSFTASTLVRVSC
jgi:hypothetical protein